MATGQSPMLSDIPVMRKIIQDNRKEALRILLDAKTPEESNAAIRQIITKRNESLIAAMSVGMSTTGAILKGYDVGFDQLRLIDTIESLASAEVVFTKQELELIKMALQNPARAKEIGDAIKSRHATPTADEMYWELVYNSLLSSPATLQGNFVSTGLWLAWQLPHQAVAGIIDKAVYTASKHKLGKVANTFFDYYYGGPERYRQASVNDIVPMLMGMKLGAVKGTKKAGKIIKTGHPYIGVFSDRMAIDKSKWSEGAKRVARGVIMPFSFGNRIMRASDAFISSMAYEASINEQVRRASAPVKNLAARKALEEKLRREPTDEMMEIASAESRYSTFNDMAGKWTNRVLRLREPVSGAGFIANTPAFLSRALIPFLNTIVNYGKRSAESVPGVGIIFEAMARGEHKRAMQKRFKNGAIPENLVFPAGHSSADVFAKLFEGGMIMMLASMFLDEEELTGQAPSDPKARSLFYAEKKQPFSVKIGDKWVSIDKISPLSAPIMMMAMLRDTAKEVAKGKEDPDKYISAAINATKAMGPMLLNSTWADNLSYMFDAAKDERRALRVVGNIIEQQTMLYPRALHRFIMNTYAASKNEGNVVPFEYDNIVANAFPTYAGLANSAGLAEFPWKNKTTALGEEIEINEVNVFSLMLPINIKTDDADIVEQTLADMGTYYPDFSDKVFTLNQRTYKFDPTIYYEMSLLQGSDIKKALREIFTNPKYKFNEMDIVKKTEVTKRVTDKARQRARKMAIAAQFKKGLPQPEPLEIYD
jgi:hypothetical protein